MDSSADGKSYKKLRMTHEQLTTDLYKYTLSNTTVSLIFPDE